MYFRASMDRKTRLITSAAIVLLFAIPGFLFLRPAIGSAVFIVAGLNTLVCLGCLLWAPRGYSIEPARIQVHRLIGPALIPLVSFQSARPAEPADFKGIMRTFGNGGLFGIYGYFTSPRLGAHRWFSTRSTHLVVVIAQDTPYVLSPDNPVLFLKMLNKLRSPGPEGLPPHS